MWSLSILCISIDLFRDRPASSVSHPKGVEHISGSNIVALASVIAIYLGVLYRNCTIKASNNQNAAVLMFSK